LTQQSAQRQEHPEETDNLKELFTRPFSYGRGWTQQSSKQRSPEKAMSTQIQKSIVAPWQLVPEVDAAGAEAAGLSWALFVLGGMGAAGAGVFGAQQTHTHRP
jgi:hypothetical protein